MSLIVNELNQILYRIIAIGSDQKSLRSLFENIGYELAADSNIPRDLAGSSLPGDQIQAWLSFNLGRRSDFNLRVSLAGFSVDRKLPSPELLNFCDGILINAPRDAGDLEKLFALELTPEMRQTPVLCLGFDDMPEGLRKRALTEFIKRNFAKVHSLPRGQTFLGSGVEWYLIH